MSRKKKTFWIVGLMLFFGAFFVLLILPTYHEFRISRATNRVVNQLERFYLAEGYEAAQKYCYDLKTFEVNGFYFVCSFGSGASFGPGGDFATLHMDVLASRDSTLQWGHEGEYLVMKDILRLPHLPPDHPSATIVGFLKNYRDYPDVWRRYP